MTTTTKPITSSTATLTPTAIPTVLLESSFPFAYGIQTHLHYYLIQGSYIPVAVGACSDISVVSIFTVPVAAVKNF